MPAPDTEELLHHASRGDVRARDRLLELHRPFLRRLVAVRLDRRVAARVDPSDIVQDAMVTAAAGMDGFFERRPLPFVPWLRRIAVARVADAYRRHVRADRRSVSREISRLPGRSAAELAKRLIAATSSPSRGLRRREAADRVHEALQRIPQRDRDVLVFRYLEGLSTEETADVLGVSQAAVKVRLLRAIQRLRDVLGAEDRP